ncbi:M24 family metallopeptidase [Geoglobus ahangari]
MSVPRSVYRKRIRRAQEQMESAGIDAFLALSLENYRYFTGDVRKQPRMFIPANDEPFVIVFESEIEEAERKTGLEAKGYRALHEMIGHVVSFLNSLDTETPTVAVEMEFSTPAFLLERFRMANPHVEVVDAKQIVAPLRKFKDRYELDFMRKAGKLADIAMEKALELLRPGVSEREIALEVEYHVRKKGAERLAFPMFVNSGERSLWLHGLATDRKIEDGDVVLIDVGPVYEGYCADIARTFVVGNATEEQRRVHRAYVEMQEKTIEAIEGSKGEVSVLDLERRNAEFLKSVGFGDSYVRGFVHGIGLNFEETPFPTIFPEDLREIIEKDMTLSVGHSVLSVRGVGGFRVEDTIYVGEKVERLTTFTRELLEV